MAVAGDGGSGRGWAVTSTKLKDVAMNTGTTGAVAELKATIYLMELGYQVFRAISPNCPCDLIALDPSGKCFRVEVKTRNKTANDDWGTLSYDTEKFDILILVQHASPRYPDGEISLRQC
jgi:Holliday junction resolvase-like predicted endonuclease